MDTLINFLDLAYQFAASNKVEILTGAVGLLLADKGIALSPIGGPQGDLIIRFAKFIWSRKKFILRKKP